MQLCSYSNHQDKRPGLELPKKQGCFLEAWWKGKEKCYDCSKINVFALSLMHIYKHNYIKDHSIMKYCGKIQGWFCVRMIVWYRNKCQMSAFKLTFTTEHLCSILVNNFFFAKLNCLSISHCCSFFTITKWKLLFIVLISVTCGEVYTHFLKENKNNIF